MNTHFRIVATTIGFVALLAISAVADDTLQGKWRIPFAFTANDTAMTAGVYTVSHLSMTDGVIVIHGQTQTIVLMTGGGHSSRTQDHVRFVFNRYGKQYFLREVWLAGRDAHTLHESRAERESATELRRAGLSQTVVTIEAALN